MDAGSWPQSACDMLVELGKESDVGVVVFVWDFNGARGTLPRRRQKRRSGR